MHCVSPGQGLFGYEETSEIDTLSGYLLTLIEQRRELQKHILNQVVRSTDAVTAQFDTAPLTQEVLNERKSTQMELLQLPQQSSGVHSYEAVQRLARPAAPRSSDSEYLTTAYTRSSGGACIQLTCNTQVTSWTQPLPIFSAVEPPCNTSTAGSFARCARCRSHT
jgi:hypothetical protein